MKPKSISSLIFILVSVVSLGGINLFAQEKISRRPVPKDFSYPEASETVEIEEPFSAKSLSGIIELPNGGGIADVLVERVSSDWSTRLDAAFTDSEGRFSFSDAPRGTYYLKLSKTGFSTLRVKVHLNKKAKSHLKLALPLGI